MNHAKLSPQESRVCELLLQGMKPDDIAPVIRCAPKTVYSYKYRAFRKLAVFNLAGLRARSALQP